MIFFRKACRSFAFCFWFITVAIFCRTFNHGKKADRRALDWTLLWAKVCSRIIGLKISVEGDPEKFGGGLIVANHQSYMDILVLASVFRIRFAPKAEMKKWPLIGFMTQCNNPVWIDRSSPSAAREAAALMSRTMKKGMAMLVFPEGTTSDGKDGLLQFKSTAFESVIDAGKNIQPVILQYDEKCRKNVQWVNNVPFLSHVWNMLGLKKTIVKVYIMDEVSTDGMRDRKTAAALVHDIMDARWRNL